MPGLRRNLRLILLALATSIAASCAVTLVAPYNAGLQQQASAMQAEVSTWDLAMRGAAGTVTADPRYPDVVAMLNKWHGEADAMLTLAVSNDPGLVHCGAAVIAIHDAIVAGLPADLRAAAQANVPTTSSSAAPVAGCESVLVANLGAEIDEIGQILNAGCKLNWIDNAYFASVSQNRATAPKPPTAPHAADQDAVTASCGFEFMAQSQTPANAANAGHGVAVSRLLRTLQAIVYVENRKKAAAASN